MDYLESIPQEIFLHIVSQLSHLFLKCLSACSTTIRQRLQDDVLWKLRLPVEFPQYTPNKETSYLKQYQEQFGLFVSNNQEVDQKLSDCNSFRFFQYDPRLAIRAGNLPLVRFALETQTYSKQGPIMAVEACSYGHLEILKYLVSVILVDPQTFMKVCSTVDILQWGISQGYEIPADVAAHAGRYGNLDLLKWMHSQGIDISPLDVSLTAARRGRLAVVEWIFSQFGQISPGASRAAACNNYLHVLQWLHERGMTDPTDPEVVLAASNKRCLPTFEWLLDQGFACNSKIPTVLAKKGLLGPLKRVISSGVKYIRWRCLFSASDRYPEMVEYLLAGDSYQEVFFGVNINHTAVVREGRLTILKELSIPVDMNMYLEATSRGHIPVLQYARETSLPDTVISGACWTAISYGRFETLKWLRLTPSLHPWGSGCCQKAATKGRLDILQWLQEEGCPFDKEQLIFSAVSSHHMNILQWLKEL